MQMHQVGPGHWHGKAPLLHIYDDWIPSISSQKKKRNSTEIECMWHAVRMCGVCVCVCVLDLEGNWVVASRALAVYLFLTGYNDCLVGFHGPLSPPFR